MIRRALKVFGGSLREPWVCDPLQKGSLSRDAEHGVEISGISDYHERTKHRPGRYAVGPGGLDWRSEPDPRRVYAEAPRIELPLLARDPAAGSGALCKREERGPESLTIDHAAAVVELSLGLSAWKGYGGTRWALRMNPSSGNLHPVEAYLLLPPLDGEPGRLCHYEPFDHVLEVRALGPGAEAGDGAGAFVVVLTSIWWRECWKYGERAFRYCLLDAGHAAAAVSVAAGLFGLRVRYMTEPTDNELRALTGLDRTAFAPFEDEDPVMALLVEGPHGEAAGSLPRDPLAAVPAGSELMGAPNRLSAEHDDWSVVYEAARITEKRRSGPAPPPLPWRGGVPQPSPDLPAASVIRRRRSGRDYDGRTAMTSGDFFAILESLMPAAGRLPYELSIPVRPSDLFIFVHRVEGLEKGLYVLVRSGEGGRLRGATDPRFLWRAVEGAPQDLELRLLRRGDLSRLAALCACGQAIAADGAFSLAMVTDLSGAVEADAHAYRRLHWEAGLTGQVLYLQATARGLSGTGIGCFFDDLVRELLGIDDDSLQCVYLFAVGKAVGDERLSTAPPYAHLAGRRRSLP
ncbi:MAG TPA: SagB/ThcOx family dehydrogenase [Deltaproteobacteria bacterium]|nr:SagB/ThcOx family dehydrogenase [Deltaproteobacteria bacterium]